MSYQDNSIVFVGASGTFKGTAEPVTEPTTWPLGIGGIVVIAVVRRCIVFNRG